jgi:hypothetical protein
VPTKHHTMKLYWGSEGIASGILEVGTRWRWVFNFTLRPLYPQIKSPWYPLHRRLGVPQSCSGCGGEEKDSEPLPIVEPLIIQPVVQCYTAVLSVRLCVLVTITVDVSWPVMICLNILSTLSNSPTAISAAEEGNTWFLSECGTQIRDANGTCYAWQWL